MSKPKRIQYKGQIYEEVSPKKLRESDDWSELWGEDEDEFVSTLSDTISDDAGEWESIEDVDEYVTWLRKLVTAAKKRFR